MSSNPDEEVRKEPLLPVVGSNKKAKSARFQVAQVGDEKKKGGAGDDEADKAAEESSGLTHQGSHQFTQYAKSFRHYLTRDVLPSEHNYRNLLSFSRNSQQKRPTMQELRDEEDAIKKEVRRERKGRLLNRALADILCKVR